MFSFYGLQSIKTTDSPFRYGNGGFQVRFFVKVLTLSCLFGALELQAAPTNTKSSLPSFFENGKVDDYFEVNKIKRTENKGYSLEVAKKAPKIKEEKQEVKPLEKQPDTFKQEPPKAEETLEEKSAAILKKYGDPSEPFLVKAQKSAPAPLKAYYEAKNAGNDELAAKYMKQYVLYLESVNKGVDSQVREQMKMRECLGLSPVSYKYPDLDWLCEAARDNEEDDVKNQEYLNEEAKKVIEKEKKRALNNDLFNNKQGQFSISDNLNEKEERNRTRILMKNKVPAAPGGYIDIYFYLRTDDETSIAMASDIEKLYQITKDTNQLGKINFVALALDNYDPYRINEFKKQTRSTFPIIAGADAARLMRITTSPTAVFVATRNGKQFVEVGPRNFFFYSEILNLMKGDLE